MVRMSLACAAVACTLLGFQEKSRTERMHIVSVNMKTETGDYGFNTQIDIVADTQTVRYKANCTETHNMKGGRNGLCAHVEAGRDYDAEIWPTAIDFPRSPTTTNDVRVLYSIDSEVEK